MGREIRVTVDDDEVFERMKARKRELDLSWREVLHRGLWTDGGADPQGSPGPAGSPSPDDDFGDRLERQIKQRVERSLRAAFGDEGPPGPGHVADPSHPHDHDAPGGPGVHVVTAGGSPGVEDLEDAEDAVLRFPFAEDDDADRYGVPLRVNLKTSADGLDVEVVAVRTGKSVGGMNRFDRGTRMRIAEGFSRGELGRLELGDGEEGYDVEVALSWGRGDGGPTVEDVDVEEVVFGGD